jgi:DNA repair exonuclease SbcCD ATPase subunit
MKLIRVSAEKLFSTVSVCLNLNDIGLVLVEGMSLDDGCSNGSGKSTVANKIILWTLFGRTAGGLKADKVVHKNFSKDRAFGQVHFTKDGVEYTVSRERNPSKLLLYRDGEDISSRIEKDTQELINSALGRDFNTFLHTDFFGQGRKDSFLELTPKQQGELLEDILPLDQVDQWTQSAKELRDYTKEVLQRAEAALNEMRASLGEVGRNQHSLQASSCAWIKKRELDLATLNKAISRAPSNSELEKKFTELTLELSAHTTISPIEEITQSVASWQASKEQWIRTLATIDITPIDDTCSTCDQQLPVAQRDLLLKTHEENKHNHEVASNNVDSCTSWIQHWNEQKRLYDKKLELRALKDQIEASPTVQLTRQRDALLAETDPYVDLVVKAERRADTLASEIKDQETHLESIRKKLERVEFWVKAFAKDFKALLFQKACPYLESRTREHLSGLGNPQLKVTFSTAKLLQSGTTRDEFNIQVSSDTGGGSFDALSGGEQQMVSFAVGLALADLASAQVGGPSEIMILDEPFMSLSEKNCESIINYITDTISKYKSTILLISNEPNMKSLISNRIEVVKTGGVTSIARQT